MIDELEHELRVELRRLARMPSLGGARGPLARRPPALVLVEAPRPRRIVGSAFLDEHRIEVVWSPQTTHREALAVLAHELVHIAGFERHDQDFKRAMARLVREAWGIDVFACVGRTYTELDLLVEDSLALRVRGAALWSRVLLRGLGWS